MNKTTQQNYSLKERQAIAEMLSKPGINQAITDMLLKLSAAVSPSKNKTAEQSNCVFTQKELDKMPKNFKKLFRYEGFTARVYKRPSGKDSFNYEIRLRRDGYDIYASANLLDEAKRKFIEKLDEYEKNGESKKSGVSSDFKEFAEYFFENFYKRKVTVSTYRIACNQFKNHIAPHFGKIALRRISPKSCQELIDKLISDGKAKTADDVCSLLNIIFKAAIKHGVLSHNPMDMVIHKQHQREHGTPLTKEEEKLLLTATEGTPYQLMYAVALYTGMRPNEYPTAKIDGDFIIANNSKRKNGKVELKKIPITPMLKPYLENVTELKFCSQRVIHERFNKILPNHKLYDLRTTFYTRCQECGVAPVARDEFVGHSQGALANAYTHLSDEFLIAEGNKLSY